MNLLALYIRDFNQTYLIRPADRREAFWTVALFFLALAVVAVVIWQAPSLKQVLAVQP